MIQETPEKQRKVKGFDKRQNVIDIGERVRSLRKERKWTQGFLAKKLNVSYVVVSHWERNDGRYTGISLNSAMRLAEAFGMTLSEFVGEV